MNKVELIKALAELIADKMEIDEEPTNGEVIQALFPYIEVTNYGLVTQVKGLDCDKRALDPYRHFWSDWWNSPYPYQKGGE